MTNLSEILQQHKDSKIMIYGLGTETERFLAKWGDGLDICGLLDGFREDGEAFGLPVFPHKAAVEMGIELIIVVARPGSCKAIAGKIGELCRENGIALVDVRGKDLLSTATVSFDLPTIEGRSKKELMEEIKNADVISFDLFDTLVTRKVYSYTDIFELMDLELRRKGVEIPDFSKLRLGAEKELSRKGAPKLNEIYDEVLKRAFGDYTDDENKGRKLNAGGSGICIGLLSSDELSELEWKIDFGTITAREDICEICRQALRDEKRVLIITDSYYSKEKIEQILDRFDIQGYEEVFVSCEYGTGKTQRLFEKAIEFTKAGILHIGDDETADIESATKYGISTFKIMSGMEMFDALGGMGLEQYIEDLSGRLRTGLFIAKLFNSPFTYEGEGRKLAVKKASDVGYLFCAPMITDFILWLKERLDAENYKQIIFCARDGFLIKKLYEKIDSEVRSEYFLTSRTAAIRAGMESIEDIEYINGMRFFGSDEEALKTRFGIDNNNLIMEKSENQRENYKKYIHSLGFEDDKLAMFDFVAKGTTQMYLRKLFSPKIKGFYFLQLEPEFMADKGLDIEPFYTEKEREFSAIYDNYYIIETMLTAPYPQLLEFDQDGRPVYAKESRSQTDILCFEKMQAGIEDFFDDYISILPEDARIINKKLDEALLAMINHIRILDSDFNNLKVEDPFFGRMTNITDVVGAKSV